MVPVLPVAVTIAVLISVTPAGFSSCEETKPAGPVPVSSGPMTVSVPTISVIASCVPKTLDRIV